MSCEENNFTNSSSFFTKSFIIMRNLILLFFLSISLTVYSQFDYGFKAGVSFSASGRITNLVSDFEATETSLDNATGFNIGTYVSMDIFFLYLRPELQFTRYSKNFESVGVKQSKLELPVTVGYKFLPFLSVFAGPSLQYIISQKSDEVRLENLNENMVMAMHIGTRLKLGPLGLDLRYERGLKPYEVNFFQNNANIGAAGNLNTQPEQWIVGLSYSFN